MTGPAEVSVSWYDGRSALRHEGLLCREADGRLILRHPQAEGIELGAAELVFREERPGERVYGLQEMPGFRLLLKGQAPAEIEAVLPRPARYGRWIDRLGLARAALGFAIVSAALAAVALTVPSWLGPLIPASWERRMGEAMVGDFGHRICHTQAGDAALTTLAAKLDPGGDPIGVGVANVPIVNAVALPGGQVLLFNGLVQQAKDPDEIAAVLAHEIGHVRKRHVMTALLRQFGISILTAGAGTGLGNEAFGIAQLGYSREAESEADEFARARLARARISSEGGARFFERERKKGGDEPGWANWLQSHPASLDRERAFHAAVKKDGVYAPALSGPDFAAIRGMCREDKTVKKFSLF